MSSIIGFYAVGTNQIAAHGDQKKLFTSKSTLIYSDVDCYVWFNSQQNTPIYIIANTWYEFKSNIFQVFYQYVGTPTLGSALYLYFEGVMYDEGRRPE